MNKETFNIIKGYESLITELYSNLYDLGVTDKDEIQWAFDDFKDYHDRLLKIGDYEDKDNSINRDGYLKEKYSILDKYIKLLVIYEYENGYCLCQTTAGLVELIPKELISYDL